jgi:hypothetical protein
MPGPLKEFCWLSHLGPSKVRDPTEFPDRNPILPARNRKPNFAGNREDDLDFRKPSLKNRGKRCVTSRGFVRMRRRSCCDRSKHDWNGKRSRIATLRQRHENPLRGRTTLQNLSYHRIRGSKRALHKQHCEIGARKRKNQIRGLNPCPHFRAYRKNRFAGCRLQRPPLRRCGICRWESRHPNDPLRVTHHRANGRRRGCRAMPRPPSNHKIPWRLAPSTRFSGPRTSAFRSSSSPGTGTVVGLVRAR